MIGDMEWDSQLVQLASVYTKGEEDVRKICDIAWDPKVRKLETGRIMGSIRDVFVDQSIM